MYKSEKTNFNQNSLADNNLMKAFARRVILKHLSTTIILVCYWKTVATGKMCLVK